MRRSSATISLFAEPSIASRGPGSLIVSVMAHGAAAGILYFGVTHLTRIDDRSLLERYSVRQLDLHAIDPRESGAPLSSIAANDFYPDMESRSSLGVPPELSKAMRSFIESATGKQTLIQPEFHSHLTFAEQFPLPNVVIWTPELAPGRKIVAPLPAPATAANVKPSLELPNEEIRLADMGVASTKLSPRSNALPAGTTSPVQLRSDQPVEMAPATTSDSAEQPTPTAVLSLSDMRMQDGTVRLPPVNEVAPAAALRPDATQNENAGTPAGNPNQGSSFPAAGDNRPRPGSKSDSSADSAHAGDEAADDSRLTTEHVVLPKSGRFGVVVVGDAVGETYPEALEIWGDRVAYTVYLHVGLSKNWILQYSVLRSAEAADAGSVARLEAPWPYDILRPNLTARDLNTDALMIHGILTSAGRFESLAIAFPSRFRYASFVLHALRQWQFRPARRGGLAIAVEVLLIIPDELE